MIQISDTIYFDETKSFEQQSPEFLEYANHVFSQIDFKEMSNLADNQCTWTIDQDRLRFIAKREYLNAKFYSVKKHRFNVEIL